MSDLKATPGPWDAVGFGGYVTVNSVRFPVDPDEDRLEGESWLDMRERTEQERREAKAERLANMTLQKAAPELYEQLNELIELDKSDLSGVEFKQIWQASLRSAKEVLAKARGESQ